MRPDRSITILPQVTLIGARAGVVGEEIPIPANSEILTVQTVFAYGSGGTNLKVWVQTTLDGGTTWADIMCFAFTTSAATKVCAVTQFVALTAATVTTDAALGDDSIVNGLLGDRVRVKWTSTGTYAGASNVKVTGVIN
jgi:hypothetical protein